jgi:hypothetical protein
MPSPRPLGRPDLIAKPRLTVREMTDLLAGALATLPNVHHVEVVDGMELSVALASGQHIEVQTLPVAARLNASSAERQTVIEEIVGRCA